MQQGPPQTLPISPLTLLGGENFRFWYQVLQIVYILSLLSILTLGLMLQTYFKIFCQKIARRTGREDLPTSSTGLEDSFD